MKIKIYGSRGTLPFFSRENLIYGGNTSCVRIETRGRTILLDGGTGLVQYSLENKGKAGLECDILLTHLHFDHIFGFLGLSQLFDKSNKIRIFTKSRGGAPLAEQIFGAFVPPYWPIPFSEFITAEYVEILEDTAFFIEPEIKITPFKAEHPDDTTVFRIDSDKSVVYLMDYEVDKTVRYDDLVRFCENADLIIFDAAYLPEDYPAKKGWGHSTYETALALAKDSNCKKMVLSHFSHEYNDSVIESIKTHIKTPDNKILPGYDGMEIEL
ncbi:MAG: MBL fold metallo-hydrolase [Clostridiales bacterium]|jgi:phosphoribosyl 1,2-cyclic phosphodiesterase|nr:MBL fold metallo-hydrolase [Clostridiales bacterium]